MPSLPNRKRCRSGRGCRCGGHHRCGSHLRGDLSLKFCTGVQQNLFLTSKWNLHDWGRCASAEPELRNCHFVREGQQYCDAPLRRRAAGGSFFNAAAGVAFDVEAAGPGAAGAGGDAVGFGCSSSESSASILSTYSFQIFLECIFYRFSVVFG